MNMKHEKEAPTPSDFLTTPLPPKNNLKTTLTKIAKKNIIIILNPGAKES
jgi:hypothetical protein